MTDGHSPPWGVIESRAMAAVPFEEVTAEFAAIEEEGDGSLRHWSEGHWRYFVRGRQRIGRAPNRRMPVVCEQFELVFRAGTLAG